MACRSEERHYPAMKLRLKEFRKRKGLTLEEVAGLMGMSSAQVSRIENGKSDTVLAKLHEFAVLYDCSPADLISEDMPTVPLTRVMVRGEVQAGAWRESYELDPDEWREVLVPALPPEYKNAFGVTVKGDSMNEVYPEGTTLVCIPLGDYPGVPQHGDHVIIRRRNALGEYETTVKEMRRINGHVWLYPRSTNPEFLQPIEVPLTENDSSHAGHPEIEVIAIVAHFIGSRLH